MKMKHLLLSALGLFSVFSFGQNDRGQIVPASKTVESLERNISMNAPKTTTCNDSLKYPFTKEALVGPNQALFLWGLWTDDNEAISQTFTLGGSSLTITGVQFLGAHNNLLGTTSVDVLVSIYNVDGNNVPTTLVGSATTSITNTVDDYYSVNFSTPLVVTNNYAVVIEPTNTNGILSIGVSDTLPGQVHDEDLSRMTSTFYTGSNGNWVSVPQFTNNLTQFPGGQHDYEPIVAPIVSYDITASFDATPAPQCVGEPVDFTSTATPQDILTNRMYSYQNFREYFSLAVTDSTFAYASGDGSIYWEQNPTHTYGTAGNYSPLHLVNGGFWENCTDNTTQVITIDPLDDATFAYSATEYCSDATDPTPTITGLAGGTFSSTAGLSINGSTGTIDVSASTPGTYTVTYTTSGTCPNSSTSTVTISVPATADFSYGQASYCGDAGTIAATLDAGATAGTYTATPSGLTLDTSTGEIDINASDAGNYVVTNTIAAANGCTAQTATVSIEIIELDDASFVYSSNTLCSGGSNETPTINETGTFTVTPTGLDFVNTSTGEINMSTSADGTYDITFTTSGACPNSSTEAITITSSPDATFSYAATQFCAEAGTEAPSFPSGSSAGTFTSTPAGLSINAANGTITLDGSAANTYTVTNTIAASGSCPQVTSDETITINALPTVDAGTDQEVCDGDQVTLTATGADTYVWDNGVTQGTAFTPSVGVTTYTVVGEITATGCQNTDEVDVTVNEIPTIDGGADQEVCAGEEVTLTATASAGTVSWDNSVTDGSPFTPTATTTYTATADNNGCISTDEVVVTVNDLPTVDAGADETACANHAAITLTGTPAGGTFSGTSVSGNEFDPSVGAGTYTVTYTYADGNGCEASDDLTVTVDGCVSIDENNLSENITLMPNPATDFVDVVLEGSNTLNSIQVTSAEGKVVEVNTTSLNTTTTRIDLSKVSNGTYLIQLNTSNGQVIRRVVVQ